MNKKVSSFGKSLITLTIILTLFSGNCFAAVMPYMILTSKHAGKLKDSSIIVNTTDPFILACARNWGAWTGTANATPATTVQTINLIDKLGDPTMAQTSEDAAALAAIAYYYSLVAPTAPSPGVKPDRNPTISLTSIFTVGANNVPTYTAAGSIIANGTTNSGNYTNMAQELQQLKAEGFRLYNNYYNQPNFASIQQNKIGDCYLMSAIGWLVYNRPSAIPGMITASAQGNLQNTQIPYSYYVRLPGMSQSTYGNVTLTQAEVVFFSKSSTVLDGMWEPVIQKAVAQALIGDYPNLDKNEILYNLELNIETAGTIQKIFNNVQSTGYYPKSTTAAQWGTALSAALNGSAKMMVQAMTPSTPTPLLVADHWHAVLAYNATTQQVTLWNPWGDTYNGRVDGVFTLPLQQFHDGFACMVIE